MDSKKWIISIVVLALLVIGLSCYIVFDKFFVSDEFIENNVEENNDMLVNENNVSWVDYLIKQQFVSATLYVCKIDDNYVYNKDMDMQPNPGASRDITQVEFNNILKTVYESSKENNYGEVVKGYDDYLGPACRDELVYKYIRDGKEYEFTLAKSSIVVTEDEKLIEIFNSYVDSYPNYVLNHKDTNYYNLVKDMMKDYVK